jgi:hypothetical protein
MNGLTTPETHFAKERGKRRGDWIQTYTGRKFWPLDPRPEDIDLEDIAYSLSMKCRYSGHCLRFYSVLQHSIHVEWLLREAGITDTDTLLWGILHDASEAYLPDVPRPIKSDMPGFKAIEERVMRAVAERFGLTWPEPSEVKIEDTRILLMEKRDLMTPEPPWSWGDDWLLPAWQIPHMSQEKAKETFLERVRQLMENQP